jgi:hypothetical protein
MSILKVITNTLNRCAPQFLVAQTHILDQQPSGLMDGPTIIIAFAVQNTTVHAQRYPRSLLYRKLN